MRKFFSSKIVINILVFSFLAIIAGFTLHHGVFAQGTNPQSDPSDLPYCQQVDIGALGFKIPSLADILTFIIRIFFVIAGLVALVYMLLGALAWITSGGDKDSITAAREKIQAALIGLIMIVVVLAIMWTVETIVFKRKVCVGLSCPVTIPGLIKSDGDGEQCQCIDSNGLPFSPPKIYDSSNPSSSCN